jgi:hypothetical protein
VRIIHWDDDPSINDGTGQGCRHRRAPPTPTRGSQFYRLYVVVTNRAAVNNNSGPARAAPVIFAVEIANPV